MRKKSKFHKKHSIYSYLLILAIIAVVPLLRYTPFAEESVSLRKAASKPTVTVSLPVSNGSYTIFGEGTGEVMAQGSGLTETFELKEGRFEIRFDDIYGYETPKSLTFSLLEGLDRSVSGNYLPSCGAPLLGVKVFPDNAEYQIFDYNNNEAAVGEGSQFFILKPGDYKVKFLEMPGYNPPAEQDFWMKEKVITTVNVVYGMR